MNEPVINDETRHKLLTESADHEGHAQCLLCLYPDRFHFTPSHGWLVWNGRYWQQDGAEAAVERAATNVLKLRRGLAAEAEKMEIVKSARGWRTNVVGTRDQFRKCAEIQINIGRFDNMPDLINCANGVISLKTAELLPHSPTRKFTYCLPVAYKPGAPAVGWLEFLSSLGLSQATIDYLQVAAGYSMTGHTSEEVMFYLYGLPRSGKGTFTEVMLSVLGELGTGVNFRSFTAERYGDTSNFDLAPLKNKRFITASESDRFKGLNTSVIKQITGGDEIYCSYKRKDHFSYRPQFKLWLTSNWPANADVDDDAAWGRLRIIKFGRSFLGQEDKGLKARLKSAESLEGVLAWAVAGARQWYAAGVSGLSVPDEIQTETNFHRELLDNIGQFINECCEIVTGIVTGDEPNYTVGSDLYHAYAQWCTEQDYTPYGRKRFTSSLVARGFSANVKKLRGVTTRVYEGIRLR